MITQLQVKNYALIKELSIDFGSSLNVITGETGAGKSIMLGALGLLLGNRADAKTLEYSEGKCVVEGHFAVEKLKLEKFFEENDLDFEPETILRREINQSGKSRAFVNDIPVTLNVLKELGEKLVDIHSQHSNLLMKQESFRREFIDFIAQNETTLTAYKQAYKIYIEAYNSLQELKKKEQELKAKADFNKFQYEEIAELKLDASEYQENERELDRLNNSERLSEAFSLIINLLDEGPSATLPQLVEMKSALQKFLTIDPKIEELNGRIEATYFELQDLAKEFNNIREDWTFDAERLELLNERQDKIQRLLRKHVCADVTELLQKEEVFKTEFDRAENFEKEISELEKALNNHWLQLQKIGNQLSKERTAAAKSISPNITAALKQLGIPDATFLIEIEHNADEKPGKSGFDRIYFNFSANKGIGVQDVSKVASGGEISRIMLALKALMSHSNKFPTLIFDEIDLGISGEVAIKMGALMKELSKAHQLVCITHLPQIAAMGQKHFKVQKMQQNNKSYSTLTELDSNERVTEIGQMIGGIEAGESALQSAKELLQKFAAVV